MPLVIRAFTSKDLRYYYFYYRIGCLKKNCSRCRIQQETKIFCHLLDGEIVDRAEWMLTKKFKALRFNNWEHASRIHSAALHRFNPSTHKVGRAIASWDPEKLERLAPVKRRSRVIWYFVFGSVSYHDKRGKLNDRFFRSKSFPALSPEEGVKKAEQWLAKFEKRIEKRKETVYDASVEYANRNRGSFSFPGTNTNLLRRLL